MRTRYFRKRSFPCGPRPREPSSRAPLCAGITWKPARASSERRTSPSSGSTFMAEKDLAGIGPGCEAAVRVQAYPGREFKGRLALVDTALDEKTRTVVCRVETPNAEGLLKPGMYADVVLTSASKREAILIPEGRSRTWRRRRSSSSPRERTRSPGGRSGRAGSSTGGWRSSEGLPRTRPSSPKGPFCS